MTPLTKIAELRKLSDAANTDKMTCTHEPCSEESRLWLGVHERAMLDGRLIGKERADAELIAALWNNRDALLAVAEAAEEVNRTIPATYDESHPSVIAHANALSRQATALAQFAKEAQ